VKLAVEQLEQRLFAPFGRMLRPSAEEMPEVSETGAFDFFVLFRESTDRWQIGYLEQAAGAFTRLERHPNTPEVFAPVKGDTVLVLAEVSEQPRKMMAFRLDEPVVLSPGVWHGVVSLDGLSEVLIVENADVIDEYFELDRPIDVSSFR